MDAFQSYFVDVDRFVLLFRVLVLRWAKWVHLSARRLQLYLLSATSAHNPLIVCFRCFTPDLFLHFLEMYFVSVTASYDQSGCRDVHIALHRL